VAGRSTRSLDVTVNENEHPETGPSKRAVAFSRAWLVIWGILLVALGIGIGVSAEGIDQFWGIAIAAFGAAHFVAARYASARVAFFFAWLGP
jgi:hypothetical protein